jgi:hypothetical protein
MKTIGQTLKIFLADGIAEGLKVIEKSNWVGKCTSCSRSQFPAIKGRDEFKKTGIYLIYGNDLENNQPIIYLGEGDPVLPRLEAHDRGKDFWEHLILFTSKDENLNKAHIQYLEARLVGMAKAAKRCKLENGNSPTQPALSESDVADMENFLENMVLIYGVLGLPVFETPKVESQTKEINEQLFLRGPQAEGMGFDSVEGFIVLKGSKAKVAEVESTPDAIKIARSQLVADGLFVQKENSYELTQDYTFTSPSKAAAIFLARNANGRIEWKNKSGKTLKDIQEHE